MQVGTSSRMSARGVWQRCLLLLATLLSLAGCDEQILHDLDEAEANRVVSALHGGSIDARRVVQADGRWAISVKEGEAISALDILSERRTLVRRSAARREPAESSLIPSREEQWLRYQTEIAAGVEETLLTVPGVLEAHVHLHLPRNDPILGSRHQESGSASVLLVIDEVCDLVDGDVAALVAGAAGLTAESVRVMKSTRSKSVAKVPPVTSVDAQLHNSSVGAKAEGDRPAIFSLNRLSSAALTASGVASGAILFCWWGMRRRGRAAVRSFEL